MEDAVIRARWPQRIVEWFDEAEPVASAEAKGKLSTETLLTLTASSPVAWVPLEAHLALLDALNEVLGRRFAELYATAAEHALAMPLFDSIIQPVVRLAGRRALTRGFPRGWAMVMRGVGEAEVEQTDAPRMSIIRFRDVPRAVATREGYRGSIAAVLGALAKRGGYPARVETDDSGVDEGLLVYRLIPIEDASP